MPKILNRLFSSQHTNNTFSPNPGSIPSLFHSTPTFLCTPFPTSPHFPCSTDEEQDCAKHQQRIAVLPSGKDHVRLVRLVHLVHFGGPQTARRKTSSTAVFFVFFEERRAKRGESGPPHPATHAGCKGETPPAPCSVSLLPEA